jgi:hypothetical protein
VRRRAGPPLGIATTSPWRTLSVTGTVGFDGLTGSTGADSLCLDSNKQVVYNSASDNCLSSTRATKHDIQSLELDSLSLVELMQPVSFVYNGSEQVRYGFIAEDTASVDPRLATYDAAGAVSGIDDRSILAVIIGAIKDLWSKVLTLIESDEAPNARIKQLEEEVAALKAAAGAATGEETGAPGGLSAPAAGDADTATITRLPEPRHRVKPQLRPRQHPIPPNPPKLIPKSRSWRWRMIRPSQNPPTTTNQPIPCHLQAPTASPFRPQPRAARASQRTKSVSSCARIPRAPFMRNP